jgi:hypothetical protein
MRLHPNQARMLERRGFRIEDGEGGVVAFMERGNPMTVERALECCRALNGREKQSRWRGSHPEAAAAQQARHRERHPERCLRRSREWRARQKLR